jgi:hypothetical protein
VRTAEWAEPRRLRLATVAIVVFVIAGLITHGTYAGAGDPPHYLMIAYSLAFDGDLELANNYAEHPALIAGGTLEPEAHAIPGKDGRLRPVHDIGMPLIAAPIIRVLYPLAEWTGGALPPELLRRTKMNAELILRHALSLMMAVVAGFVALQIFELLRREGIADTRAMLWSLLMTLSPPLLSHSFLFFTEIPSALLVLWLVRTVSSGALSPARGAAVGVGIGLLPLIHVRNIGFVIVLGPWVAMRLWRARATSAGGWCAAAAAVPLAIRSAAQWTFWGTLLTSPHARPDWSLPVLTVIAQSLENLAGMFADRHVGLLIVAPIYLLAIPGFVLLFRRSSRIAMPVLVLSMTYVATVAIPWINVHGWTGGFAPAARMILPAVALLAIPVAIAADAARNVFRAAVVILVLLQVGIDGVMWNQPKRLWGGAQSTGPNQTDVP